MKTCLIVAGLAVSSLIPTSAFAAQDCAALANLKIDDTNLLSAVEVPASGDLPAYCRVLGYVRPAINFEIRLPLREWNGKFYRSAAAPSVAIYHHELCSLRAGWTLGCGATTWFRPRMLAIGDQTSSTRVGQ